MSNCYLPILIQLYCHSKTLCCCHSKNLKIWISLSIRPNSELWKFYLLILRQRFAFTLSAVFFFFALFSYPVSLATRMRLATRKKNKNPCIVYEGFTFIKTESVFFSFCTMRGALYIGCEKDEQQQQTCFVHSLLILFYFFLSFLFLSPFFIPSYTMVSMLMHLNVYVMSCFICIRPPHWFV